jgi:hypothetical protein
VSATAPIRRRFAAFAALSAPKATAFLAPPLIAWRRWLLILLVLGFAYALAVRDLGLTAIFFLTQDLPVAAAMLALAQCLYLVQPAWAPTKTFSPTWRAAGLLALAVVAVCWAGTFLVYDDYALSMDEFLARFDAQILATGRLAATIPEVWRPYAVALQPKFVLQTADHSHWVSPYLPVNAAFLALTSRLGAMSLAPPLWAGLAVAAVFGIARRLWPDRPAAAWVAALLLATSAQVLVTAMTPYAMSAHLALNLTWLWLVLRGGRLGHGAAAGVALLATGLHQMVFHPLFAAPFILEMWLAKRWKPALWHSCAYAAICVFWMIYPGLLFHALTSPGATGAPANAGAQAVSLLRLFQPVNALGFTIENIVRFVSWQSLLAAPLAAAAIAPALRRGGVARALALGPLLTIAAMAVLMPYQGHGWGYRYLHGQVGSVCLLAAWGWDRLGDNVDATGRRMREAVFAAAAAASLLVLFPWRAWQAHATEHQHAVAMRQLQALPADVVVVRGNGAAAIDIDSVRNDPFLRNRPLVMYGPKLTDAQLASLCRRSVTFVGSAGMEAAGAARPGPEQGCPQSRP